MAKSSGGSVGMAENKGRVRKEVKDLYTFEGLESSSVQKRLKELFGTRKIDKNDLAELAGAFKGSIVSFSMESNTLAISVRNSNVVGQLRYIMKDRKGLFLKNEYFAKSNSASSGIGAKMLAIQAKAAGRLGIDRIKTEAAGSKNSTTFNGYYTWPRLGYDGKISDNIKSKLPKDLKGSKTVQDLFKQKGGSQWWKENGSWTDMVFDTRKGSNSRKILSAYIKEKGKRKSN